jgi:hypothetical protein
MLIVIPLLLLAIGAGLIWFARRLRDDRATVPATGTVVGLRRRGGDPGPSWFPVVRFQLPDGRTVEAESTWGSRPARVREGDSIELLYDPADPTTIRLPGEQAAGAFFAVALILTGAGLVVLGVLLGVVFALLS